MTTALLYLGGSLASAAVFILLYMVEDTKGHRIVLGTFRGWLDKVLIIFFTKMARALAVFNRGFVRVFFHYGTHALLKKILVWLQSVESRIENLAKKNRTIVHELNEERERNHLDELSENRVSTALTKKQRDKMQSH